MTAMKIKRLFCRPIQPVALKKFDIVHHLARRNNYRYYLELCTATTGWFYHAIDPRRFQRASRLMYNCPADFDDGLAVDYRSAGFDISAALAQLRADNNPVDICLVDSYHSYEHTKRDLTESYRLLPDGGMLVVHDCLPPTAAAATPTATQSEWCGVSYKAYLDFVLTAGQLDYCTVDCDYGCGLIIKNRRLPVKNLPETDRQTVQKWFATGDDYDLAYGCLGANKNTLLRLISPAQFYQAFKIDYTAAVGGFLRRQFKRLGFGG